MTIRTEKAEGPQEPGNGKQHRDHGARPRRGSGSATTGFGNVMRDVRDVRGTAGAEGSTTPGMPGFDPTLMLAAQADAGAQAAKATEQVASGTKLADQASFGVQDASEALTAQDQSAVHQAGVQPLVPTALGRMTPSALLETVLDESTRLAIDQASKELHVELEPAHLGPIVVRLLRQPDGQLDIRFRAREGDAARVLEAGSDLLRDRLAAAGFAAVRIDVEQDGDLRLGRVHR
jgi:hypothetical protein